MRQHDEYTIFDDPEYVAQMEELQRYDYEALGQLWEEEKECQSLQS